MADYVYNDWVTLRGEARLARLQLHIQEVSASMNKASVAAHGYSKGENDKEERYLARLEKREDALLASLGRSGGNTSFVRRD